VKQLEIGARHRLGAGLRESAGVQLGKRALSVTVTRTLLAHLGRERDVRQKRER
jgi:hypothetical protein